VAQDVTIEFTVAELALAFTSSVVDGVVVLGFDPEVVRRFLEGRRDQLEAPPVDARLEVDGYDVVIVPGRNGTLIDPLTTAESLAQAASSVRRQGDLPFVEGAEPAITTADLEALGIRHLVSEFTTYHPCCQPRVTNIQLMADIIDGAIVMPGETFGVNEYVGERTTERGFLEDGTIIRGELVPTVGGGVSQFATTMYNAIFWGRIRGHRPPAPQLLLQPLPGGNRGHDLVAATGVGVPQRLRQCRVDPDGLHGHVHHHPVLRRQRRSHRGRRPRRREHQHSSDRRGGPDARRVRSELSDRFNPTEPPTEYRANPNLEVDQTRRVQSPGSGWTVIVTRIIERGGVETEETWTVRYLARREILEVHPCMMPEATEECPEPTTTTTLPPETTTTAPGEEP
jgi:hypothetical protein